jgi:hypothetical protein
VTEFTSVAGATLSKPLWRSRARTDVVVRSTAVASELQSSFAQMLPRLYELANITDQSHPDAYFRHFEQRLTEGHTILPHYQKLEGLLSALDDAAWSDLKSRAADVAHRPYRGRGWQALFDAFNEARGYVYLHCCGCTEIAFIPRTRRKTPDLRAIQNGTRVLCEVKTINISKEEADRRERVAQGAFEVSSTPFQVTAEMLSKIITTIKDGIAQLDYEDPQHAARRVVFTVLNFDDWVGDYQTEYIAQLDAHLLANPVAGAELVFCPASNLFERRFMMRSALVVEI